MAPAVRSIQFGNKEVRLSRRMAELALRLQALDRHVIGRIHAVPQALSAASLGQSPLSDNHAERHNRFERVLPVEELQIIKNRVLVGPAIAYMELYPDAGGTYVW